MKLKIFEYFGLHNFTSGWKAMLVLITGLVITLILSFITYRNIENHHREQLASISMEIGLKIDARLHAHAIMLRAGTAHFAVSDTVTRDQWRDFVERSRLDINLPGIQGVGYSMVIRPDDLHEHIRQVHQEGFSDYTVYPEGDRDLYTSIVYLEPFSGRNLRAFGYDMYSEPVRRKAMALSRDNDVAMLTGKVDLVQETGEDVQAGTLMYAPDYDPDMPSNTVEARREAIRGWVYSPYRMRDLMRGILGQFGEEQDDRVRLQIYDHTISDTSLLYDSQSNISLNITNKRTRTNVLPIEFNGTNWLLVFTQSANPSLFSLNVIIIFISGIIISFLLYLLSLSYFKIRRRSIQINNQNEELHKLNATKDKFFSIIAHDLKSPFNSIIGFSKILIDQTRQKKYDSVERYADIIHQSSNIAMELLTNLMEWSQSQTGRIEFNPEKFDLVELLHEAELLFTDMASHKSIEIRKEVPESLIVYADYEMVGTILRNLISNAVKFTKSGGYIIVSARKELHENVVSVSDTGVGIPRDKTGKLFRIDESYSTKGTQNEKGTGLGLILCREFVEKHNGRIWVESFEKDPNDIKSPGSIFYFTLPYENSTEKKKAVKKSF
jgi:signal transduction histidine kinase